MRRLIARSLLVLDALALLAAAATAARYGWTTPAKLALLAIVLFSVAIAGMVVVGSTIGRRRELVPPPVAFDTRATVLLGRLQHPERVPGTRPLVRIEAEVTVPGRAPVWRTYLADIPYLDAARVAEGLRFPCLVDPTNLDRIRIYLRLPLDAPVLTGEYADVRGVGRTVRSDPAARAKLLGSGPSGCATVLSALRSDRVTLAGEIRYLLKLSVQPSGASTPYPLRCAQFVPVAYVERVVPGATVRCALDPADRHRIELDFSTVPAAAR
jgi:hypothetical protein